MFSKKNFFSVILFSISMHIFLEVLWLQLIFTLPLSYYYFELFLHSKLKAKACNTCIVQAAYRNCRVAVHVTD